MLARGSLRARPSTPKSNDSARSSKRSVARRASETSINSSKNLARSLHAFSEQRFLPRMPSSSPFPRLSAVFLPSSPLRSLLRSSPNVILVIPHPASKLPCRFMGSTKAKSKSKNVEKQQESRRVASQEQALQLMEDGEFVEALQVWDEVLEENPSDSEALFYRGECYLVAEHFASAENDYRAAIAIEPDMAIYHHRLGEALLEQRKVPEAVEEFTRAIEMEESAEYLQARAQAYIVLKDTERALADLNEAIELEVDAESLVLRGELYAGKGMTKEALRDYSEAISLDPYDAGVWRARAVLRSEIGQLEGALEDLEVALQRDPNDPTCHADHGRVLVRLGKPKEARFAFEKALELSGETVDATVVAAYAATLAALDLGHKSAAQYERAIRLAPKNVLLHLSLAELWCSMKEWERAVPLLNLALSSTSLDEDMRAVGHYHRGRARAAMAQLDEAYVDLDKAVNLAPENASFVFERGTIAARLGRQAEAEADFKRAKADEMRTKAAATIHERFAQGKNNGEGSLL